MSRQRTRLNTLFPNAGAVFMGRAAPALFLLASLIFCQLASASVQWSYSAQGPIIGKPALISDKVVFASYDGKVYGFNAERGSIAWVYDADGRLTVPVAKPAANSLAVASESGKLSFLSSQGKETATATLPSVPLYMAADSGIAFISLKSGVRAYSDAGKSLWNFTLSAPAGPIGSYNGNVYFTSGGKLYSLDAKSGAQNWAVPSVDSFMSAPAEYGGSVYLGATDGRLYAYDSVSGRQRWHYQTGGWVQSIPAYASDAIFFGSDDGYLYSLSDSGKLRFRYRTNEGVWSEPTLYSGANRQLAAFGSNDGNVYCVDASSGEPVWSFSAGGRVGPAAEQGGVLYFGTSAGKFYSLSPSPICSFSWPPAGTKVGDWQVTVQGTAYSDSGVQHVDARIEGGIWQRATGTDSWRADLDFAGLPYGAFKVECRAADSSGSIQSGDYSTITLVKSQGVPLGKMHVSAPASAGKGEKIEVSLRDSRGMELSGVTLSVAGEARTGDSPFSVELGKSGSVQLTAEKPGFETASFTIQGEGGGDLLTPLLALAVIAALGFFAYKKFLAKKVA
jgi:outer membrane protein assembly factor BamB